MANKQKNEEKVPHKFPNAPSLLLNVSRAALPIDGKGLGRRLSTASHRPQHTNQALERFLSVLASFSYFPVGARCCCVIVESDYATGLVIDGSIQRTWKQSTIVMEIPFHRWLSWGWQSIWFNSLSLLGPRWFSPVLRLWINSTRSAVRLGKVEAQARHKTSTNNDSWHMFMKKKRKIKRKTCWLPMPSREVFTWLIRNASSHLIDLERSEWIEKKRKKSFRKASMHGKVVSFYSILCLFDVKESESEGKRSWKNFLCFPFRSFPSCWRLMAFVMGQHLFLWLVYSERAELLFTSFLNAQRTNWEGKEEEERKIYIFGKIKQKNKLFVVEVESSITFSRLFVAMARPFRLSSLSPSSFASLLHSQQLELLLHADSGKAHHKRIMIVNYIEKS